MFYDGTTFHRIVKDFMIQAGSKDGDGTTGAKISDLKDGGADEEYTIKGEFLANGVTNTIKFEEGTLAMARADYTQYSSNLTDESYNSGCSQFFIMTKENTNLNGYYTAATGGTKIIDIDGKLVSNVSDYTSADGKWASEAEQLILYAQYIINTYTVEFDNQGHGTKPDDQTINHGGKVNNPGNLTANGFIFGGWYREAGCINAWDFSVDITGKEIKDLYIKVYDAYEGIYLYAKWVKN